ncbi:MAG: zf-TFIIB domain-containing protein [Opitutales bacterium]
MALCSTCGAPLSVGSVNCGYCGHRNEVDFVNLRNVNSAGDSRRPSPITGKPMRLVSIQTDGETIEVDQCPQSGGLWFDQGELEYLLTHQIKTVFRVDDELLAEIRRDRVQLQDRGYLKCPVCSEFMPFKQYQQGSGVIVDWCRLHGIWLDGGELAHLIEWARAGGLVKERNAILRHQVEPDFRMPERPAGGTVESSDDHGHLHSFGGERRREPGVSLIDAVLKLFDPYR